MPKVTYTPEQGLVQSAGSGVDFGSAAFTVASFPYTSKSTSITTVANNTGSLPGLYVTSAGSAATIKMPLASAYPGGMFIFRNGDGYATVLTGSGEAAGTRVFSNAVDAQNGSKITLSAAVGSSVAVVSTGVNYLILASSGSLTVDGT